MEEFTSESIALPDSRALAYATYGPEDGTPLFFHHGTPGSAHLGALLSTLARKCGVRVIAPSRPGYGRSDPDVDGPVAIWHGTVDENVPIGPVRTAYGGRSGVSVREVDADHLGTLLTVRGDLVDLVA